jgi:transposase
VSEPTIAPTCSPPSPCSRAAARQAWVERLARFPTAGLSPAQFCAQEAVSLPSFYSWKRRLAAEAAGDSTEHAAGVGPAPRLLPVHVHAPDAVLELVLPRGPVLRIPPGCDLAWVRSLVEALGGAPC